MNALRCPTSSLRLHDATSGGRTCVPLLGLLIAGLGASCAPSAAAQSLRTQSTQGGRDARGLLMEQTYTLSSDGSRAHRTHQRIEVISDFAIDKHGDPRVAYNAATQTLEVVRLRTTMRDGTEVDAKPNSINQTTPDAVALAPAYADMRETVLTHVGMEKGCTNDLEYVVAEQPSSRPLWGEVPLHTPFPIDKRTVRVTVPTSTPFHWACLGCDVEPTESSTPDGVERVFEWTSLTSVNLYEAGRHTHSALPGQRRLIFSTASDWPSVGRAINARLTAAAAVDDAIRERARTLIESQVTLEQKLLAIWRFVARDLGTIDWPLADFGHQPATAATVLQRSHGHSLDKAVLLKALLAAAEIESRFVLVSRDHLFSAKVPALGQMTEVWLIADLAGQSLWLSPTRLVAGDARAQLEGRYALDPSQGAPFEIQAAHPQPETNQSVLVGKLSVKPCGKIKGELALTLTGTYNPFVEVDAKSHSGKLTGKLVSGLGTPEAWKTDCKDCDQRVNGLSPSSASFSVKGESQATRAGRVIEVHLPWAPRSQLAAADIHRSQRQTAMALRSRGLERTLLTITVPKSLELRSALPSGRVTTPIGEIVTSSEQTGTEIKIERSVRLTQRIIDPASYAHLKMLAAELLRADARSLLFIRKKQIDENG